MKRVLKPDDRTATNPYPCKRPRHESPSTSTNSRTPASSHTHLDEQWVSATVDMSTVVSNDVVMQSSDLVGPTIQEIKSWDTTTLLEWVQKQLDVPLSDLAGSTTQEIESWDRTTLLQWIQKKLKVPLDNDHIQKFLNAEINGSVFLSAAGQKEFFQEAGIPLGPSMQLAQLAQTIVDGKDVQKFLNAEIDGSAFLSAAGRKEFFQEAGIPLGPSSKLEQLAQTIVDGERQRKREYPFNEGLISRIKRAMVVRRAPSSLAKSSIYESMQKGSHDRILDDRPQEDGIPPISLLYDGFGQFLDIVAGATDIKNLTDVKAVELQLAVDKFAVSMCGFFTDEDKRRDKGLDLLNEVFAARKDRLHLTITAGAIGSVRSDGHFVGGHGVATVISEFKNRSTGNSGCPEVELVGYFARSFAKGVESQSERLQEWRVPGLGITVVGPDIKFYAVLSLGDQFRLVSLTPALSCIPSASEGGDRSTLYRAFTAALVLQARILKDGAFYRSFTGDCGRTHLPGVSKLLKRQSTSFKPDDSLEFQIQRKFDRDWPNRLLYLAKAYDEKTILVKFVRHYCVELHDICASSGHAPALLAFERLPGGWYGVAMEYVADAVPITEHRHISKHFKNWKIVLQGLVAMFHNRDFVHGDLRDANIISGDDGHVQIVDFDWGGRIGEVSYPTPKLNIELVDGRSLEDLRITKADDLRILANTLAKTLAKSKSDVV